VKKKILIIGVNSFIGNNLYRYLKKKFNIKIINYSNFVILKKKNLIDVNYIINCASNKEYVKKKYSKKNDFDIIIAEKIVDLKCKLIFFSSRKVYKSADNIKENSKFNPTCNYSRNKLITETRLNKILNKRVLVLRTSNLIGLNTSSNLKNKIHNTFIDNFFLNARKNKIFNNYKIYKDFLPIDKFNEIIFKLINKNITGIYNISLGQKVYLNELIDNLNFYNLSKYKTVDAPKHFNNDCFYLNNNKLLKTINVKISLFGLKRYCRMISNSSFKK
jgi:nucleoside-diphosphate-sugar epimerase